MADKDKELEGELLEEEGEDSVDHKDQLLHQKVLTLPLMLDMEHQAVLEDLWGDIQEMPEIWNIEKR